ncbi:MAG: hypothetical protein C5B49_13035 [Bdellovibrio sp.]|nr:MAG: hypothetical protein C5B49_13035 [Bdellovibrio sp.]
MHQEMQTLLYLNKLLNGGPAEVLRARMMRIRSKTVRDLVRADFRPVWENWLRSIPLITDEIVELVLASQGLRYSIESGLERRSDPIDNDQRRKIAAIKYLIKNNLKFVSSAQRPFGEARIVPRKTDTDEILHKSFDFWGELLGSLKQFGVEEHDGEWKRRETP